MNEKIKRMDLNEFRSEGFLQEVNRLFFHPLGLALEVRVDDEGNVDGLGGIWDYRDDPEGIFFSDNTLSKDKMKSVEELKLSKIDSRIKYALENRDNMAVDYKTGIQIKKEL